MQSSALKETIAYRYLARVIEKLAAKSVDQLTPIRLLASESGLSATTLKRALKRLQNEGIIVVPSRRRGARIAAVLSKQAAAPAEEIPLTNLENPREYRWDKIRRLIAQDVLNGTYKESQKLPSHKELCLRYGDCYRTIAKALTTLAASGLISEYGNSYIVTPLSGPSRTTIYLFVHDFILPAYLYHQDERRREFFRLLEVECKDHALSLKIADVNGFDDIAFAREYKATALGAIVWCPFNESKKLLDALVHGGRPVAIIDEAMGFYHDFTASRNRVRRNIRFVALSSESAAKSIGKMLLGLGHRRIAYISPYRSEDYVFSRQRLESLGALYAAAGIRDGVTAILLDKGETEEKLPGESLLGRPEVIDFYDWAQNYRSVNSNKHPVERLLFSLQLMQTEEKYRCQCLPLFERALNNPHITAWVCANDLTAVFAQEFLEARNKRCPADISLVGFDDLFQSFQRNITSYNFNTPMLVYRLIHYFLNPKTDAAFHKKGLIEIPGHIMQRGSVGKPRNTD
ncbi:MAG: substrate-binding domain-containing protein [Chitinivibrionales bacterium]|nr:substrate-binding domain-containing protein [Chitinivibrionales bacterium]